MDEMFPHVVDCPHCGGPVSLENVEPPRDAICPHCGGALFTEEDRPEEPSDDLNGNRIRQIATLRRAAHRTRSYYLIGAGVCLVGAAQLIWLAVRGVVRYRSWLWALAYVLVAAACLWAGVWFSRCSRRQIDELRK